MGLLSQAEVASMVETVNELANATLLEIAAPGPLAPNGDPGEPVSTWTGEAPAKLMREQRESTSGERERQGIVTTLQVYDAAAPAREFAGAVASASTVVIRDETRETPVTSRWTVKGTSKETEGTLDGIVLELDGQATA